MRSRNRRDSIELTIERGQATTILVGSVMGLGLVFLLGVVVGSRLAPAPALAAAPEAVAAAPVAAEAPATAEPEEQTPELTFHDALTSKRIEPAPEPEPAPAPAAKPAPRPEPKPEPVKVAEAKPEPAKPAPAAKAAPAPAKAEAPAAEPVYTVQVASSREEKDTQRLADRLEAAGYDARVVPADIPGKGRWYRVRVGRYDSRDDAAMKQAEIKVALNMAGLVVAE